MGRSHDSGYYDRKYQLRLDEATSHKPEALTHTFDRPAAAVIRQLIIQATLEDFRRAGRWPLKNVEEGKPDAQRDSTRQNAAQEA